jgi:uncharacterized protein YjbI with pentapeptide repeats
LRHANLSGVESTNLAEDTPVNLRYADLGGASLTTANLPGADLRDANLLGADLNGIWLTGAKLARTDFSFFTSLNAFSCLLE